MKHLQKNQPTDKLPCALCRRAHNCCCDTSGKGRIAFYSRRFSVANSGGLSGRRSHYFASIEELPRVLETKQCPNRQKVLIVSNARIWRSPMIVVALIGVR